jgi:hypothetical protein
MSDYQQSLISMGAEQMRKDRERIRELESILRYYCDVYESYFLTNTGERDVTGSVYKEAIAALEKTHERNGKSVSRTTAKGGCK